MTTLITKNSSTASAVPNPSDLVQGELAVNVADKKLYTKDNGGSVVELVSTNDFTDAEKTKLTGIETGATADQTAAEIKTAYESNSDTNAFTDADHSKLDGIEANATADQTASEILTALLTVDGTGSSLDADKVDGYHISTASSGTDANTIYFRTI